MPASATDADNDALTYSIAGLPASLTLNPQSGLVSGTVLPSDIGSYLVTLSVTDGQSTESQTFTWTVADPNRAPVLTNPGDQRTSGRRTSYSEALLSERPLAYWRLDDTTGTAVHDTVANSHGEREGAILTGVAGALPDGNAAMSFDGADTSRIVMPNGSVAAEINGGTAITMEAWINPQSAALPSRFRMFYSFPGAPASYLGITDAYGGSLKVIGALRINGTQRYLATGPTLTPGTWYHTALTYDGAQLTLFVNGSVAGQLTGLSGPISIGSSVLLGATRPRDIRSPSRAAWTTPPSTATPSRRRRSRAVIRARWPPTARSGSRCWRSIRKGTRCRSPRPAFRRHCRSIRSPA